MCFGGPHKGLGFFVTYGNIFMNGTDQFGDAAKYAVAQSRRSDVAEESLDHVEPGRRGRDEMNSEPGMLGKPRLDLRMLVGRIVITDQMKRHVWRHLTVDLAQEVEPLDMAVALRAACCAQREMTAPSSMLIAANKVVVP